MVTMKVIHFQKSLSILTKKDQVFLRNIHFTRLENIFQIEYLIMHRYLHKEFKC